MRIRQGGPADAGAVLALFDEAVEWLVARGRAAQWGSEPLSRNAKMVGTYTINGQSGQIFERRLGHQPGTASR